jgi:hypothetical protein
MAAVPSFRLAFGDSKLTGRGALSICVGRTEFTSLLMIQYESGAPPVFRIFAEHGPARIVVVMVQEHYSERENVWVIGPPGMQMTEHEPEEFELIEQRPATSEEIGAIYARSDQLLAPVAVPIATIKYGVVPPGFNQMKPESGPPSELIRGEKYEVVVMAAGDFGSLEFIA